MSVARFAVRRRVAVTMFSAAIALVGLFAAPRLAVALLPTFAPPVVTVSVAYTNASPETIESSVTRPIENAVSRVAAIDILESNSYQGLSTVRIQFAFGTDINVAAVDVQQQVARIRASLPNDPSLQEPQIVKADPNATAVISLAVADKTRTQRELSDLIVNQLSDELASAHGVGSVGISGVTQRAIMIEPQGHKLAAAGITMDTLLTRIKNENVNLPAGVIRIGQNEYGIRTNELYTSPEAIADMVITTANGVPVRLRDVATVHDAIQEQRVFSRINGAPSVLLSITAQPDANIVSVADALSERFAQIGQRYPSIQFTTLLDQREFILAAARALEHTALYGVILAMLIVLIFLHSWRTTIIVAVSLPVSILGALFVAYMLHETLNVITLGGLALAVGLIVDDAVVVIENITRYLRTGMAPEAAAEGATTQIFGAVFACTVTVVTVFLPLMFFPGLQGLIFGPFAIVVMSSVGISLLVAVTTVPMLAAQLLRRANIQASQSPVNARRSFGESFDRAYERLVAAYRNALSFSLDRPVLVLGAAGGLLALTIIALELGFVPTEIFPPSDTRFVQFGLQTPNGTALENTDRISRQIENAFRADPRVVAVASTVGQVGAGGNTRSITNRASFQIVLKPGTSTTAFVQEWLARLKGTMKGPDSLLPASQGALLRDAMVGSIARGQPIDIVQSQISQGQTALELEIFGPDLNTLQTVSDKVMQTIARIPGVGDPDKNVTISQPEINVVVDRTKLMQLGLGTGDLAQVVSTATNGSIASYYQVNGIQYPIIVQLPPAQRRTLGSLQNLPFTTAGALPSPAAALAPAGLTLGGVASVATGLGPSDISREDLQRRVEVQAPLIGRPLGPVLADTTAAMRSFTFPRGYRWEFGPEIMRGQYSFGALYLAVALAIVLIYMLLAAQFESYIDPLLIMVAVPLSFVGIVGSLLLTQRAFGLTAFIGSLMLVGIAVKNSILVVEFTKQLREHGMDVRDALMRAGPMRLRPILMTTFATLGGMSPLAIGLEAGSSTQAPLATVVIGGLIASTFLSLFVVPTLYLLAARMTGGRFRSRASVPSESTGLAPTIDPVL